MRGSDFAELRAFAEVARRSSFSRAAEQLRVSPSTLSQTVRALEGRLGVTLLSRTTRRVALTSAGARLLERFAPALDEMEAALTEAQDGRARPRGTVRLHAPRPAYAAHIEPRLGRLADALPDVTLDLVVDDAPVDVAASGFDLVIRRVASVGDDATRHLGADLRHAVVASSRYLATHGAPATPDDLAEHRCILWRPPGGDVQAWHFKTMTGEPTGLAVRGPLVVSHCEAAVAAARQGVGIACVLQSYVLPFTEAGELVPLLTGFLPPLDGWKLCYPRHTRLTAAARAIADILARQEQG